GGEGAGVWPAAGGHRDPAREFLVLLPARDLHHRQHHAERRILAVQPVTAAARIAIYILNTPNRVGGIGALSAAEKASASTRRVSAGAMMPSSQIRAVASYRF